MAKKKWIKNATENKGALHRAFGVAEDKKIPEAKIDKATNSKNPTVRKEAALAKTLKGFSHKKASAKRYGSAK